MQTIDNWTVTEINAIAKHSGFKMDLSLLSCSKIIQNRWWDFKLDFMWCLDLRIFWTIIKFSGFIAWRTLYKIIYQDVKLWPNIRKCQSEPLLTRIKTIFTWCTIPSIKLSRHTEVNTKKTNKRIEMRMRKEKGGNKVKYVYNYSEKTCNYTMESRSKSGRLTHSLLPHKQHSP